MALLNALRNYINLIPMGLIVLTAMLEYTQARIVDLSDYTDNEIGDSLTAYPYDNSLFLDKLFGEDVGHMMTKTRRRRHGVYDECCRKPCNYTELASYCL